MPGRGFRRGSYRCYCKPNYYPASAEAQRRGHDFYDGEVIESAFVETILTGQNKHSSSFQCLPCRIGCDDCLADQPCYVEYDLLLRSLILCFQSFCSTIVVILIVVICVLRKTRVSHICNYISKESIKRLYHFFA